MKHHCTNARPGHGLIVLTGVIAFFMVLGATFVWSLGAA